MMTESIMQREEIEWLNYWIESANSEKRRILLIGDSVTRQYRKTLNDILLPRGYAVDLIATSYGMTDPLLYEELSHFIHIINYSYETIIFQLGAHHGYSMECRNSMEDKRLYEFHLRKILKMLARENVQMAVASGTPERESGVSGKGVENHNEEIRVRNSILKEISDQEKYIFIDLYQSMMEHRYRQVDQFHFVRSSDEYIANRIVEVLFGQSMKEIYHKLDTLDQFKHVLKKYKKIYIYGNGKRGNIIEQYFKMENREGVWKGGYIVSPQFRHMCENTYLLSDIEADSGTIIIVTPSDYEIYSKLNDQGHEYVSLGDRIYVYLEEHVNANKNVR